MKDVCANMCFGHYCMLIPTEMTWDTDVKKIKDARRDAAGCITGRCTESKSSYDEFPFASTKESESTEHRPVTRCVPVDQQNGEPKGLVM